MKVIAIPNPFCKLIFNKQNRYYNPTYTISIKKCVEFKFTFYIALIIALVIKMRLEMTMDMTAVIMTKWVIARVDGGSVRPLL